MTFDFSLQRMKALIGKEFIQLKRDRPTLVMIVMLPVMQLLLFGYAINMDPKHMPAAVILRDNTFLTRSLTAALEKSDYFKFTVPAASDVQGDRLLRRGDVIAELHVGEKSDSVGAYNLLKGAIAISDAPVPKPRLIHAVVE